MKIVAVVALLVILVASNAVTLVRYFDTHDQLQIAQEQIALDQKVILETGEAYQQLQDKISAWYDWANRTVGYCPTEEELAR